MCYGTLKSVKHQKKDVFLFYPILALRLAYKVLVYGTG